MAEVIKTVEDVDKLFSQIVVNGEVHESDRFVPVVKTTSKVTTVTKNGNGETTSSTKTSSTRTVSVPQRAVQGEDVYAVELNDVLHNFVDRAVTEGLESEVTARQEADRTLQDNLSTINDLIPVQASPSNKLADSASVGSSIETAISPVQASVSDIEALIPSQATAQNQLADKDFVNSSISTNTANFLGTYTSLADIEAIQNPTNNDYAFLQTTDQAGNSVFDRYKYNAEQDEWLFEYELNNSSFTAEQWATINSGLTSSSISDVINALDVAQSGGNGKYIKAISETDGKISATEGTIDTSVTSGSANPVTGGAVSTALAGKKNTQTAVSDPTASGTGISFIDTISQDTNGVIAPHKSTVQPASTSQSGVVQLSNSYSGTSQTKAVTEKALSDGLATKQASGNYKTTQTAKTDPSASGTTITCIDTITQSTNGEITATKKTVRSASTSQSGVVQLSNSYAGTSTAKAVTEKALSDGLATKQASGNYKTTQTAVSDPTASGTAISFIDTISQDTNGVITATKKTVRSASTSQTGVVQLSNSYAGTSTTKAVTEKALSDGLSTVGSNQDIFAQNSSFPTSYTTRSLCVFNGKLYAGTTSHGIYVSSDGTTFTQNTSLPTSYTVYALCVYNGKLYVGTSSHGIYVSSDGITFTQNTSFPTSYTVYSLCVFDDYLYAGTYTRGIYSSSNGTTFGQNIGFTTSYTVYSLCVYNGKLYIGTSSYGIYSSSDGSTFTQNSSFPTSYVGRSLCVYNGKLYVGTSGYGIYVSSDGTTFTQSTISPYTIYSLCVYNGKLYVGTSGLGIYVSSDGITFTQNTSFPTSYTVYSLCVYNGKLYVDASSHGIYISNDVHEYNFPVPDLTKKRTIYLAHAGSGGTGNTPWTADEDCFIVDVPSPGTNATIMLSIDGIQSPCGHRFITSSTDTTVGLPYPVKKGQVVSSSTFPSASIVVTPVRWV